MVIHIFVIFSVHHPFLLGSGEVESPRFHDNNYNFSCHDACFGTGFCDVNISFQAIHKHTCEILAVALHSYVCSDQVILESVKSSYIINVAVEKKNNLAFN